MFGKVISLVAFSCFVFDAVSSVQIPTVKSIDSEIKKIILAEFEKIPEPLTVTNQDITIPVNDYVSGNVTINSASISGLSAAEIPSLKVNVLTLKLTSEVVFENLTINATLYEAISVSNVSYNNDVTAKIQLEQLKVNVSGKYVLLKGHVHSLSVKANLTSSNFKLTGLLGNDFLSAIVADTLTTNLANWINTDTTIFPQLSTYLEDAINAYLDSKKAFAEKLDAIFAPETYRVQ